MAYFESEKPDMEIKVFMTLTDQEAIRKDLEELKRLRGLTLKLAEDIHGNIFNRPFPFLHLRPLSYEDEMPEDLKNDGDPYRDYFFTLRSVRRDRRSYEDTVGFIFIGYKVLNDDQIEILDKTWRDWSGIGFLLDDLDLHYIIRKVKCWKACNVKPDLFKYIFLIEISGESDIMARDILQKFRIKRMSGYVALYHMLTDDELNEIMAANEANEVVIDYIRRKKLH